MNTAWFKYLPYDEQAHRKSIVRGNEDAWEVLTEVLQHRLDNTSCYPDYSNPSWAYAQAHINGKREALQEIINMLDLEKD